MYLANRMHMQMSWYATSLALLSSEIEKLLVQSRDLYCQKFTLEDSKTPRGDLQVKEVFETSTSPEPRDWRFSFIDLTYCLTILRRQLQSKGKLLDSITMRSCVHCITDRMMDSTSLPFTQKGTGGT